MLYWPPRAIWGSRGRNWSVGPARQVPALFPWLVDGFAGTGQASIELSFGIQNVTRLAHREANNRADSIGIMFPLAAWSDSLANQELLEVVAPNMSALEQGG